MDYVTFIIAVIGFVLSIYTFVSNRLGRIPRLEVFRFAPDRLVIDDDFDTLHVYTDADFIISNLSDKPNTVIRMDASASFGKGWIDGIVTGKRLAESMRTRTDTSGPDHTPIHHNEIVREWVNADVCPIMLSPQASGIPNEGVSLRFDFQNTGPITDLSVLKLRITLHDQFGMKHAFHVDSDTLSRIGLVRYPKFFEDEQELGKTKDEDSIQNMATMLRVVYRNYEQNPSQSMLSVRRYYPLLGSRKLKNVSHLGRDGYAYNSYRPRDFKKYLREGSEGKVVLDKVDGFTISFSSRNGAPEVFTIELPESWAGDSMEVAIPRDFAGLCTNEG